MPAPQHIFEGSRENFRELVIENSARGPVLVHFWAEWAGPCHRLFPVLAGLARDYGGRFLLVSLNTDTHGEVAREHAVTSLPTVKLFRHGKVLETVHGYQPEGEWRRLLDRHTGQGVDPRLAEGLRLYKGGQVDEGLSLLAQVALDTPEDTRIPLTLGRLLVAQGRLEEAHSLLTGLPDAAKSQAEVGHVLAHLDFLRTAQSAPSRENLVARLARDPADLDARYALAALALVEDDFDGALGQLLEIVQRDRTFRDGAGRRGMLAIFALLGNQGELVERYRALMSSALH